MRFFTCLLWLCISHVLFGQDAYHTNLQRDMQDSFGLPVGQWILNDNEQANLDQDFWYGEGNAEDLDISDQAFAKKVGIQLNSAGSNQWDAAYGIRNKKTISSGSRCLLVIWLRAPDVEGQVSIFAEHASTYEKEIYLTTEIGAEWQRFLIPFEANEFYSVDELTFGLHLGWKAQTIEIGGMAVIDYQTSVLERDLPRNVHNEQYGGYETDAPWRQGAADRIEEYRKAKLSLTVQTPDGEPVPDAMVHLDMLQHQYAFGSAVVSAFFAGNRSQNDTYESKLLDLDGEGHGFNWVVFENDLKWPGWEDNWITSKDEKVKAIKWLRDRDISIRGHTLVWPGWNNLPDDLETNQNNLPYLRERVMGHLEDILTYPGIQGNVAEWDVLNEITTNRDLEAAFQGTPGYESGREIYGEIFAEIDRVDPDIKTYVNDYVTISQANTEGGIYDLKKQFIQEIIDGGGRVDGVGFQAHIGGFPTGIPDVYGILEDFHQTFGTKAKITEYDTDETMGDDLAATYLRDFLTMVFSHPSTNGFLMWGFWDGAHWKSNAPLFYEDWTLKPAGEAFIDLVFNDWWTEEQFTTDVNGEGTIRGFKGTYQITVETPEGTIVDTVSLSENQELIVTTEGVTVSTEQLDQKRNILVYPNPVRETVHIRPGWTGSYQLRIVDVRGREVYALEDQTGDLKIPIRFDPGLYQVILSIDGQSVTKLMVVY